MCHSATRPGAGGLPSRTQPRAACPRLLAIALGVLTLQAATAQTGVNADWRHIGNSAIDLSLASPASGPVERVWYSPDGSRLYVLTATGRTFETSDFEKWTPSTVSAPPPVPDLGGAFAGGGIRVSPADPLRLYAFGGQVFRSDDGGTSWGNVTQYQRRSVIGDGIRDLAVSPVDRDDVVVANGAGVWRSLDAGMSWTGLNEALPNLPFERIASVPQSAVGVRLVSNGIGVIEWAPGEKQAWRIVRDQEAARDEELRRTAGQALGARITAVETSGDFLYAGSADGRLWASTDKGRTWILSPPAERGPIEAIFADPRDSRLALAAIGRSARGANTPRVLRTVNGGQFWDDLSSDLPEGAAHGITADRGSSTVYVATDRGVLMSHQDLAAAAPAGSWNPVSGLPQARALDVRLDPQGNQLFVAVEGYGVYAAMAPHRVGNVRLVNSADFSQRPAAPGSLLSVLGGRVTAARAGGLAFPVLAASDTETQIQVPFSARGGNLSLSLETGKGSLRFALPLETVSPAIFIDRDGTPLVLNGDTGVLLDAMNSARSNSRLQILATGLGRVRPDWPAGVPAPLDNSPQVVASIRVLLDRTPVEVTRAILAPGYIGLYLVEVQLPPLVNAGTAELSIESEGRESNRVRIWIEP